MNKADVTEMILSKKKQTGITWASIAESVGMSEVFVTSACLGMNSMPRDKADKLEVGQTVLPVFRTDENGAAVVEFRAAS